MREQSRAEMSPFSMQPRRAGLPGMRVDFPLGPAMRMPCCLLLSVAALALSAGAQQPAFEVASVKPHKPDVAGENRNHESIDSVPGALTVRNASLGSCIKWAYLVRDYQISGPAWLNEERYDITAKAAGPARLDELRRMLRTLLAERFSLRLHREAKQLPVYSLVAAKSGPKLHKAEPGSNTSMQGENGSFVFRGTSMAQLAEDLSTLSQVDRPVLDRTGIPGVFDFSLKIGEDNNEMKRALIAGDGPSIFTLIQEQLGLKLEARRDVAEVLVVDHAARIPSEN
jgi:uncharacterized protein (TIGR03435 family)